LRSSLLRDPDVCVWHETGHAIALGMSVLGFMKRKTLTRIAFFRLWTNDGPARALKRFLELAAAVLRQCIGLSWSRVVITGHHGYQRAAF